MRKGTGTVRAAKYGYIVMSLLSCLLGVVMLARADFTPPYAGVAVAALLAGVVQVECPTVAVLSGSNIASDLHARIMAGEQVPA